MKLESIEWDDAAGAPDALSETWPSLEDIREKVRLIRIKSVGWVVQEDDRQLVIVPNMTTDKCGNAPTAIHKAAIVHRIVLEEPVQ